MSNHLELGSAMWRKIRTVMFVNRVKISDSAVTVMLANLINLLTIYAHI